MKPGIAAGRALRSPTTLPFVKDLKIAPREKRRSFWEVKPASNALEASEKGFEYAAHYLKFLKDGRTARGLLADIVRAQQASADSDASKWCAGGFLAFIDIVLREAMEESDFDPFARLKERNDYYAECERRALERGETPITQLLSRSKEVAA